MNPYKSSNVRTGGFTGIELKFLDCAWNGVAVNVSTAGAAGEIQPSSGCTNCISVPLQGVAEQNRDGRRYTIKGIWVSGMITHTASANAADALQDDGVYMALVLDKQANGATIISEEVFVNPSTLVTSMMPQPLRNLQHSRRFQILDSKFIPGGVVNSQTDGSNTGSLIPQSLPVSLSWKGNLSVETKATDADVASATNYAIHLVGFAGDSTFLPSFVGKSRMRFVG